GREDNGEAFVGSGNMVSTYQVLTCGHNLYDNDPATPRSGFASWITVTPGMNGAAAPFGRAAATRFYVPNSWTAGDINYDLGILVLNQQIGNQTGWFGYGALPDNYLYPGLTVNRSSYPASEAAGYDQTHQYLAYGPVASVGSQMFTYHNWDLPTVGGTSGSGVYVY